MPSYQLLRFTSKLTLRCPAVNGSEPVKSMRRFADDEQARTKILHWQSGSPLSRSRQNYTQRTALDTKSRIWQEFWLEPSAICTLVPDFCWQAEGSSSVGQRKWTAQAVHSPVDALKLPVVFLASLPREAMEQIRVLSSTCSKLNKAEG